MPPNKPHFQAFNLASSAGLLRVLQTECNVSAAFDPATTPEDQRPPRHPFIGIWDTGATTTFITQAVVDQCGLKPFTISKVQGAYGGETERDVYLINVGLPNKVLVRNVQAIFGEMGSADVLIGMNIITLGDFAITNQGGNTLFSFRTPSLETIDYVKRANLQQRMTLGRQGGASVIPGSRKARGRK